MGRASFSSATFTVKSTDDAEIQDLADGSSRIRADNRYFSAISQQLWQGSAWTRGFAELTLASKTSSACQASCLEAHGRASFLNWGFNYMEWGNHVESARTCVSGFGQGAMTDESGVLVRAWHARHGHAWHWHRARQLRHSGGKPWRVRVECCHSLELPPDNTHQKQCKWRCWRL